MSRCHIFCRILIKKKKFYATGIVEIIINHIATFPFAIVSTFNTDKRRWQQVSNNDDTTDAATTSL